MQGEDEDAQRLATGTQPGWLSDKKVKVNPTFDLLIFHQILYGIFPQTCPVTFQWPERRAVKFLKLGSPQDLDFVWLKDRLRDELEEGPFSKDQEHRNVTKSQYTGMVTSLCDLLDYKSTPIKQVVLHVLRIVTQKGDVRVLSKVYS